MRGRRGKKKKKKRRRRRRILKIGRNFCRGEGEGGGRGVEGHCLFFVPFLSRSLSNYVDKVNIYMSYFIFEDNHFLWLFQNYFPHDLLTVMYFKNLPSRILLYIDDCKLYFFHPVKACKWCHCPPNYRLTEDFNSAQTVSLQIPIRQTPPAWNTFKHFKCERKWLIIPSNFEKTIPPVPLARDLGMVFRQHIDLRWKRHRSSVQKHYKSVN